MSSQHCLPLETMPDEIMMTKVELNHPVPDFEAESTFGNISLSRCKTKALVIYFYPKDNTPGCTTETEGFRDHHDALLQAGAVLFGVSRDSLKSHENWSKKLELPFPLVSDPAEKLCELFDVMKMKNMYGKQVRGIERSTFLIDPQGVLVKAWRGVKVPGHVEEVLQHVQALNLTQ